MVKLPAHLSYKSALALIPPASMTTPIEEVRRVHDRHFARWPPHINLLYPFLAAPSEAVAQGEDPVYRLKHDIRLRIEKATRNMKPFPESLSADSVGTFFMETTKTKPVWLGPTTQSIQTLQAALQAEFTECDFEKRTYTPHLSIGQAESKDAAAALSAEVRKNVSDFLTDRKENAPISLDWYIDRLFVIERKGFKDRFKVIGTIDLKQEIES